MDTTIHDVFEVFAERHSLDTSEKVDLLVEYLGLDPTDMGLEVISYCGEREGFASFLKEMEDVYKRRETATTPPAETADLEHAETEHELVGKKVTAVRPMTKAEKTAQDWSGHCVVIEFEDGTTIYPSQDYEGNGPGVMFSSKGGKDFIIGEELGEADED